MNVNFSFKSVTILKKTQNKFTVMTKTTIYLRK